METTTPEKNESQADDSDSPTSTPIDSSALDTIASASPDHFYLFDLSGRYQYASPAAAQAVGLEQADFVDKSWRELGFPSEVMGTFDRARESVTATGQQWRGEIPFPLGSGAQTAAHEYILAPVLSPHGEIQSIVATVRDVTERKRAEELLRYQTVHDPLTGLPNRTLLRDRLQQNMLAARRHGLPLAVLFLDVDDFKSVNDNFGHEVGDLLLQRLCAQWQPILRASDTLARAGGDEFVAILTETDEAGAARALQGLRRVAASPWVLRGNRIVVSVSIGVAVHPGDGAEADVLLNHSDAVMYQEKRSKSGRVTRGRGQARGKGAVEGNAE